MKNQIEQIKNTWSWNNKLLIVCLALLLANILQTFPITLPTYAVAYEAPKEVVSDTESLVEERTEIVWQGMRTEAKYRAMKEIYDELGVLVELK